MNRSNECSEYIYDLAGIKFTGYNGGIKAYLYQYEDSSSCIVISSILKKYKFKFEVLANSKLIIYLDDVEEHRKWKRREDKINSILNI